MITKDKVTEIFCLADDFRKFFDALFLHSVSYNRFVELKREVAILIKKVLLGKCTGISLVDSTPLRVCRTCAYSCIRCSRTLPPTASSQRSRLSISREVLIISLLIHRTHVNIQCFSDIFIILAVRKSSHSTA